MIKKFYYPGNILPRYIVTYNSNGASGTVTDSNSPYNSNSSVLVLSPTGLVLQDCTFVGWNTAVDGSGTRYSPGDTFTITSDITLYAEWESYIYYSDRSSSAISLYTTDFNVPLIRNEFDSTSNSYRLVFRGQLTTIGNSVFRQCDNLQYISLPSTVTSIGQSCFLECESLLDIVIPEGITAIPKYAFLRCYALNTIVIPDSVTVIEAWSFSETGLQNITLGKNLLYIEDRAFAGAGGSSITTVICKAETPPENGMRGSGTLPPEPGIENIDTLEVSSKSGVLQAYQQDSLWGASSSHTIYQVIQTY